VRVIDLLRELPSAEMRPAPSAFELVEHRVQDQSRPSISTGAPSRLIYTLAIPRRSTLRVAVALDTTTAAPIRFRVGVSDERIYDALAEVTLAPASKNGWSELQADLSAYAGWKWSLFYRPERRRWRLVLSTDAIAGVPGRVVWGAPGIDADTDSAHEYVRRVARRGA
jgi:hypothetical protein